MAGQPIELPAGKAHSLPFSSAVRAGDTIYVSGMVSMGRDGKVVGPGDVAEQTRFVLRAIAAVLEAAGAELSDVVFNQVFLKDLGDFRAMNTAYAEFFPQGPPARYCVGTPLVHPDLLVEIAATAWVGD